MQVAWSMVTRRSISTHPTFPRQVPFTATLRPSLITEEHRIWQITLNNEPTGTNYPSGALTPSEARIIEPGDKLIGDVISASDAFIVEFKENNRWIADTKTRTRLAPSTINHPFHSLVKAPTSSAA
jgi:hypothetical protein